MLVEWADAPRTVRNTPSGSAESWIHKAILPNGQKAASKNSHDKSIEANSDGSIDIYFGPEPPAGKDQLDPHRAGRGLVRDLPSLRTLQPWFEKTWAPDDIVAAN